MKTFRTAEKKIIDIETAGELYQDSAKLTIIDDICLLSIDAICPLSIDANRQTATLQMTPDEMIKVGELLIQQGRDLLKDK